MDEALKILTDMRDNGIAAKSPGWDSRVASAILRTVYPGPTYHGGKSSTELWLDEEIARLAEAIRLRDRYAQ